MNKGIAIGNISNSIELPNADDSKQQAVKEYFETQSTYWDNLYRRDDVEGLVYRKRRALALSYVDGLALPAQSQILEVGCGAGLTTLALARRGFYVQAVDNAPAMIRLTQQHARESGFENRIIANVGNAYHLNILNDQFDLVLALGVLPWLADTNRVLKEIARVMLPHSHLIISVDNRRRLNHFMDPLQMPVLKPIKRAAKYIIRKSKLREFPDEPGARMDTIKETKQLLASTGLEIMRKDVFGFGPFTFFKYPLFSKPTGVKLHLKMQGYAERGIPVFRSAGSQIIILARRI